MTDSSIGSETARFSASRLTSGNFIFPTVISVNPVQVVKSKRSWVSSDEESINIRHVSSVRIKTGLVFSDIWIESSGGTNQIFSHGHTKGDAQTIKRLIEEHQRSLQRDGGFAPPETEHASDAKQTRKCPYCAETIKAAAKVCRFCNRDL